ncbi:MAG: hypothetical protein KGD68_12680 [Candidatus Lokiarchaeota archaeon]|nr:hypothetical protein [Candidatus Lokiarchaeota archaeon]
MKKEECHFNSYFYYRIKAGAVPVSDCAVLLEIVYIQFHYSNEDQVRSTFITPTQYYY